MTKINSFLRIANIRCRWWSPSAKNGDHQSIKCVSVLLFVHHYSPSDSSPRHLASPWLILLPSPSLPPRSSSSSCGKAGASIHCHSCASSSSRSFYHRTRSPSNHSRFSRVDHPLWPARSQPCPPKKKSPITTAGKWISLSILEIATIVLGAVVNVAVVFKWVRMRLARPLPPPPAASGRGRILVVRDSWIISKVFVFMVFVLVSLFCWVMIGNDCDLLISVYVLSRSHLI